MRRNKAANGTFAVKDTVGELHALGIAVPLIDWSTVDAATVAPLAPAVRDAMVAIRRFQRELQRVADTVTVTESRPCKRKVCPRRVPDDSKAQYCSHSCRQRACEERKRGSS